MGYKFSMAYGPYNIVQCCIPQGSWENYNFLKWNIMHPWWGKFFPWPMDQPMSYDVVSPKGRGILSHRMAHGSWEKNSWTVCITSALRGDFWKKPRGSFTKYLPGTFWCELWKGSRVLLVIRPTFTHWVLGGYFVKILNMCPVGIWVGKMWANYKSDQNGPSG